MIKKQKTIKNPITVAGIGIHTGENIRADFYPAECNSGIIFKRTDIKGSPGIKAEYKNVINSKREVTLMKENIEVHTVEHLLATLSAFGITNLLVEVNGPELPIGDGSAVHFIEKFKEADVYVQEEEQKVLVCTHPIYIRDGEKYLIALPSDEFKINYTVDYAQPIGTQFASYCINEEVFIQNIARARTFGFLHEVKELWANNLAQGGSLENAVVIGKNNILNGDLRYPDELVRHKIMDLLGDLYLIGMPILADIIAVKSGHCLNIKLVEKLSQCIS
ncbi:MAG: UDP-3-O-[3-hydroxymyristoyl] N-acetylglucosamine deacetylase [Candidatus Firestonebacteria bacterium]|nr:UDP-3-O-[3-hydroxymyristoyl] N-acetylglucosamine deacetylase [Candidatus Firestonebacteria bacterium]